MPASAEKDSFARHFSRAASGLVFESALYWQTLKGRKAPELTAVPPDPWFGDAHHANRLFRGRYRFAGQEVTLPGRPPWEADGVGEAWAAEAHGFEWLRHFRAASGLAATSHAQALVRSWAERHRKWDPLAWRADVLARRLSAWLSCGDLLFDRKGDLGPDSVRDSIALQARHLAHAAQFAGTGLSALAVVRGLVVTGTVLSDGRKRLELGLKMLPVELARQFRPDGGHVSRNPTHHHAAVRELISIRTALVAAGEPTPQALQHTIDRATPVLRFFRHGDGGLALFNGGSEGDAAAIDMALVLTETSGAVPDSAPHVGFERLSAGDSVAVMDVGQSAGASGHAGPLSFEFSTAGQRLVVNCGSAPERDGEWAQALTATAAHSTITVADTNAARDGAMAAGRLPLSARPQRHNGNGGVAVSADHDAYDHRFGVRHARRLYLDGAGTRLAGEDQLLQTGTRRRNGLDFVARFHLHPDVSASLAPGGLAAELALPAGAKWAFQASGGLIGIEDSVYCGSGSPRRCLQLTVRGEMRTRETILKWSFQRRGS